jgi:hypothetical protein
MQLCGLTRDSALEHSAVSHMLLLPEHEDSEGDRSCIVLPPLSTPFEFVSQRRTITRLRKLPSGYIFDPENSVRMEGMCFPVDPFT